MLAVLLVGTILAGCAERPFGSRTVTLELADGGEYVGGYVPMSMAAFPPGTAVAYTMGPEGSVTRQQVLAIGKHGDVVACRYEAPQSPTTSGGQNPVCQRPSGALVTATEVSPGPGLFFWR